jgi:hypothetical protein
MRSVLRNSRVVAAALAMTIALLGTSGAGGASAAPVHANAKTGFKASVFAYGADLFHSTSKGKEGLFDPDDITQLGVHLFVGFQNGVGPQGQESSVGTHDSTIVEFNMHGKAVAQWDVVGKCDGLGADPATNQVIATVNEDAHSSIYVINPADGAPVHYTYNEPLPHKGGTDSVVFYNGMVVLSASAPGTTGKAAPQASYPALYRVSFKSTPHIATVTGLFSDEATATPANELTSTATGLTATAKTVKLALTDPDSSEVVPSFAKRFAGDFMLTSQGDEEQIFAGHLGQRGQSLQVLKLSQSVDDTAWAASSNGAIYTTDASADAIWKITGPFQRGEVFTAVTPCNANNAPSLCPAPPAFPDNYLGQLNPKTGVITKVPGSVAKVQPMGMLFEI